MHLRHLTGLASAAAIAAAGIIMVSTPAYAAAPAPVTAWYMYGTTASALDGNAKSHGCAFGKAQPGGSTSQIMLLDFGAARNDGSGEGALDFSGTLFSNDAILTALERASDGVAVCHTKGTTMITFGNSNFDMSNSGMTNSNAFKVGHYQADKASLLARYERSKGRTLQQAAEAGDLEPSWDGPGITKQLVNGATAQGFSHYFDFGSADGCPQSGIGGSCNNGWTVADVGYVSFHGIAHSVPEIYPPLTTLANQWTAIRKTWDSQNSSDPYFFSGVDGAPGNAKAGWDDLNNDNPGGVVTQRVICFGC
jgi:hypothetical protein